MSDETPNEPSVKDTSTKDKAVNAAKQAKETMDTFGKAAETASSAFNAVKWVAIAVTMGFIFSFSWMAYKTVSAPVKAAANATETVTDAVKSSAATVSENTSNVLNRLVIPSPNQKLTNKLSETAFANLSGMAETPPEGLKARTFWAANLKGHENRVCQLSIDFGGGIVPILLAADNKAYAGAKALGSKKDRLIRIIIRAPRDDIPLRVEWDDENQNWIMKWRASTVKKSLEDPVAAERIGDILVGTEKC